MGINKVIVNDSIKLDLTADTVTADTLANGVTAHNAAGDLITGTSVIDTEVIEGSTNAVSGGAVYTAIEAAKTQAVQTAIDSLTPKKLMETLTAGETSITITDNAITDSSTIYVATSVFGVEPTDALQYGNALALTFDEQTDNITITVYVY